MTVVILSHGLMSDHDAIPNVKVLSISMTEIVEMKPAALVSSVADAADRDRNSVVPFRFLSSISV